MEIEVLAPAKVNLTLHVTGQRDDGYHLLDSLVSFAYFGDRLSVAKSDRTELRVTGQFADEVPVDASNLVLRAAALLGVTAIIALEKNLPVASGLGGGSSDAAAAIDVLTSLYNIAPPGASELLALGADVPACATGGILRVRGIGERIEILETGRFGWPVVLVNPGIAVSTPAVFAALKTRANPPLGEPIPRSIDDGFFDWMLEQRNDLEEPGRALCPEIDAVLGALRGQSGCVVERMSGSGATCFGLFVHDEDAERAADAIARAHPGWWVKQTCI